MESSTVRNMWRKHLEQLLCEASIQHILDVDTSRLCVVTSSTLQSVIWGKPLKLLKNHKTASKEGASNISKSKSKWTSNSGYYLQIICASTNDTVHIIVIFEGTI